MTVHKKVDDILSVKMKWYIWLCYRKAVLLQSERESNVQNVSIVHLAVIAPATESDVFEHSIEVVYTRKSVGCHIRKNHYHEIINIIDCV